VKTLKKSFVNYLDVIDQDNNFKIQ